MVLMQRMISHWEAGDGKSHVPDQRDPEKSPPPLRPAADLLHHSAARLGRSEDPNMRNKANSQRAHRAKQSQFPIGQSDANCPVEKGLRRDSRLMRPRKQSQFAGSGSGSGRREIDDFTGLSRPGEAYCGCGGLVWSAVTSRTGERTPGAVLLEEVPFEADG